MHSISRHDAYLLHCNWFKCCAINGGLGMLGDLSDFFLGYIHPSSGMRWVSMAMKIVALLINKIRALFFYLLRHSWIELMRSKSAASSTFLAKHYKLFYFCWDVTSMIYLWYIFHSKEKWMDHLNGRVAEWPLSGREFIHELFITQINKSVAIRLPELDYPALVI